MGWGVGWGVGCGVGCGGGIPSTWGGGLTFISWLALSEPGVPGDGRTGRTVVLAFASRMELASGATSAPVPVYPRSVAASSACTTYSK